MIVGCYVLHLYCDDPKHEENVLALPLEEQWSARRNNGDEFCGRNASQAKEEARRAGWVFRKVGALDPLLPSARAICPLCKRQPRTPSH